MNPPIPLFKIPPARLPSVLQCVAQGESLRQIARSYHTSYEAVHRVLNAARKELLAGEWKPATLHPTLFIGELARRGIRVEEQIEEHGVIDTRPADELSQGQVTRSLRASSEGKGSQP